MEGPREEVEFLVRSACRVHILEELLEGKSLTKRELRTRLEAVRTTIGRNLDALEERELIRSDDAGISLTPAGELVAADVLEVRETTAFAMRAAPILRRLAEAERGFDPDPRSLVDATVVEATAANPYAPIERHIATMSEAGHARMVVPATGTDALEEAADQVSAGAVHETVVTPGVAETFRSAERISERFRAWIDAGDATIYRYDGEIPYYLGVLDDVVQIGISDAKGVPQAILESTNPDVREWAMGEFEAYRAGAERIA